MESTAVASFTPPAAAASNHEIAHNLEEPPVFAVPPDHWRYLWDVRRFQQYPIDNVPPAAEDQAPPLPDGLSLSEPRHQSPGSGRILVDDELQQMLADHYVEDESGLFKFAYSADVLNWAIFGPTADPNNLHLRIVETETNRLVAFLSATPMKIKLQADEEGHPQPCRDAAMIDFVCIVPKHRGKRLCPWMYQEIQRRCKARGIDLLLCTSGDKLDTPVAAPQYHHLSLDLPYLVECGFATWPAGKPVRDIPLLPPSAPPSVPLREMTSDDVKSARRLLNAYIESQPFQMSTRFDNDEEFAHTFLPKEGVVISLVRPGGEADPGITDFISFYLVDTLILGDNPLKGKTLRAAYLFYNAPGSPAKRNDLILEAVQRLKDSSGVHVVNALPLMGLVPYHLRRMRFGAGDGFLKHYLFNFPSTLAAVNPAKLAMFVGI